VALATVPAAIVKGAEVEPCGTVTDAGTPAAAGLELTSETTMPLAGAAAVRVTVPLPDWPLVIEPGPVTLLRAGTDGLTVMGNVSLTPR
jgi:hypothetical protein